MDFQPRITIESKVLPGVRFTLKRMSPARRTAFRLTAAGYFAKLRELQRERKPLDDEYRAAVEASRTKAQEKRDALVAEGKTTQEAELAVPFTVDFPDDKFAVWLKEKAREDELDQNELYPLMVRTCLVSIEGFTIDGKVPTADELIEDGPPELVDEIAHEANRVMGLTAAESGNLQSPGTSEHPEAGQATSTDASTAAPTSTSA